ncbi:MAG: hypothetical protein HY909_15235 [Deltaproteobacteria bacterium]|nr:hypothetical protein [Deltaproteobacteria bacterium]
MVPSLRSKATGAGAPRWRRWLLVPTTLLTALAVPWHLRLHTEGTGERDTEAHLAFVGRALNEGAGPEMQRLFPEGDFFLHALHGLAWAGYGMRHPPGSPARRRAVVALEGALEHLRGPEGRAPFPADLDPPYGVFWNGWTAWTEGVALALGGPSGVSPARAAALTARCDALAGAFERAGTPFLEAYHGGSWPVDSTVAMAALSLHDALLPPRYEAVRRRWVTMARTHEDPATGLLPHRVQAHTGRTLDGPRGSSSSVIDRFLPEADPVWGREHHRRFRATLLRSRLGVPGVCEHPHGGGLGDVDSGPLVLGVSLSATVVASAAATVQGDHFLGESLRGVMEAFGLPYSWRGRRRYGFGLLPVGDAFVVWAHTDRRWTHTPQAPPQEAHDGPGPWWRWRVHALGALVLGLLWRLSWRRRASSGLLQPPPGPPTPV